MKRLAGLLLIALLAVGGVGIAGADVVVEKVLIPRRVDWVRSAPGAAGGYWRESAERYLVAVCPCYGDCDPVDEDEEVVLELVPVTYERWVNLSVGEWISEE